MILSLDISTSCVGYSVFGDDESLLEMNYIKFRSKISLFEKMDFFKSKTSHLNKMPITRISIEEPLKRFKGKFSNSGTIALLNFFNGMISEYLYQIFKIEPSYYNVKSARSLVFPDIKIEEEGNIKHEIWRKVMEKEPTVNWIYSKKTGKLITENYDMSDSYVVGMADIIILKKQLNKLPGRTTVKDKINIFSNKK